MKRTLFIITLLLVLVQNINAQLVGYIIDAETKKGIPFASASYKGKHIAVSGSEFGIYTIERHDGWKLTFSAVGYESKTVSITPNTPNNINIELKAEDTKLSEVVVKSKKAKYSRKDNPAVELMKRVIAAKKQNKLENKDFYQYTNYEKLTLSINDIKPEDLDSGFYSKKQWLKNQVEFSPLNNKLILPIIMNEKVTKKIYRKDPKDEKQIIIGDRSEGINDLFETGDIVKQLTNDAFTEVDIYDDYVRLLRQQFTSPIGKDAISFYRYYIVDTLKVDNDSCYHLTFLPNNQQDFGFRGELFIMKDTTLHVKKVSLTIPKRSDINFVDNMQIEQQYSRMEDGEWVLTNNDMVLEMSILKSFGNFLVARTSTRSDYSFKEIKHKEFHGKAKERKDPYAEMQDVSFWNQYRKVSLTQSEDGMNKFIDGIKSIKGFNWIILGAKALIENFVETSTSGKPSKFDFGPINTIISANTIDGFRMRISGQTTANFNKHLFLGGYIARGFNTKKTYYEGSITYSFNEKRYLPREFPRRSISFTSSSDICFPSDKFADTDKDNIFNALKWSKSQSMMFYKRQRLTFEREEDWGFSAKASLRLEENEATGGLFFKPLSEYINDGIDYKGGIWNDYYDRGEKNLHNGKIRTTEIRLELEYSPGRSFINTKQRRLPVNQEAPVFNIIHTMGIQGFLGGQYNYHATEAHIYKRFWVKSWGRLDCHLKGGAQWSQVPYPLLISPASNLSYIIMKETFNLINNMEFINDRFASLDVAWDMNGKIFNRIPLLKHLKWREIIGFKMLWGSLSDKNNPMLEQNWKSSTLMAFPEGCYLMNPHKPYMEFRAGIHNIFNLLHVEYVRRLNYLELPTASKHGVRFTFHASF